MRRIGIDVGGTNTDAVIVEEDRVVHAVKTATTEDVTSGIVNVLADLVRAAGGTIADIDSAMIGTTHFTNAVVQRNGLTRVAAIRIGLPAGKSLPPFVDWPADLSGVVLGEVFTVEGGHEYDGRPLVPLDTAALREAAARIRDAGIMAVGITSVFSPLTAECETVAADIVRSICPDVDITLSHQLGRIGLLERENATLLNACLVELARKTTDSFNAALHASRIDVPLFLTQNDGTIVSAATAEAFPVYSFASGPTNSMRGAAFLSQLEDALVIDVGGTTTDIGCLKAGFPREANNVVEIGGVRTLFRMPDLLSLGLGGGSLVDTESMTVGPASVGYRIVDEALVFGGEKITATDVAVARGLVELGDADRVVRLDGATVERCIAAIEATITEGVDRMKTDAADVPLIAVGGAAFLVPRRLPGISEVVHVEHEAVANAVGAAIAQVSGEVDRVFSGVSRDRAIEEASEQARRRAVEAGADEASLSVVEIEDLPLAYLAGDSRRVRVRVVGPAARPA